MATVTATSADFALCEPYLVGAGGPTGSGKPRSVDDPVGTVMTENHTALIEPFLLTVAHGDEGPGSRSRRSHSIDKPLPTITTETQLGVIEPYIIPLNHGAGDQRSYSMERPMPTVTTIDAWAMIEPYLVKYYGTGGEQTTDEPLGTITAKDHFDWCGLWDSISGSGCYSLTSWPSRCLSRGLRIYRQSGVKGQADW